MLVDTSMVYAANQAKMGHLATSDGRPTGGVFGFIRSIESVVRKEAIDRCFLAFDVGGTERKRALNPPATAGYKSGRSGGPEWVHEELDDGRVVDHVGDVCTWALFRGIHRAWLEGHEADQVIAAIHAREREQGDSVVVMSRDHDFNALLDDGTVQLWSGSKGQCTTLEMFQERYGFPPSLYPSYLALVGDVTDRVEQVAATADAIEILGRCASHDDVVRALEQRQPPSPDRGMGQLRRYLDNYELTRMDAGALHRAPKIVLGSFDLARLLRFYEGMEFNSLVRPWKLSANDKPRALS